ncbi:hypothetical protein E2562_021752 [Oryza meyeriana var. granulata]|uniref:Uncharacterized protein n=1 Tax=Oryza meyeriana var. granulata TaxID=110450 RepID=A0A6G1EY21_9ORYZ|nr:hypothetical protein E2562_021752 [Oryza meyeriana var. granulata]
MAHGPSARRGEGWDGARGRLTVDQCNRACSSVATVLREWRTHSGAGRTALSEQGHLAAGTRWRGLAWVGGGEG